MQSSSIDVALTEVDRTDLNEFKQIWEYFDHCITNHEKIIFNIIFRLCS